MPSYLTLRHFMTTALLATLPLAGCVTAQQQPEVQAATSHSLPAFDLVEAEQTSVPEPVAVTLPNADRAALILNAFNEARGESDAGVRAVLEVTMARVGSACFPKSVHAVVYQPRQFSWTWQAGHARSMQQAERADPASLARIVRIVDDFLAEGAPAGPATFYHNTSVRPVWASRMEQIEKIGNHVFYDNERC
ncbi:cell wall hydrolase [Chitinibacteraceae bacterium HSL-7]